MCSFPLIQINTIVTFVIHANVYILLTKLDLRSICNAVTSFLCNLVTIENIIIDSCISHYYHTCHGYHRNALT